MLARWRPLCRCHLVRTMISPLSSVRRRSAVHAAELTRSFHRVLVTSRSSVGPSQSLGNHHIAKPLLELVSIPPRHCRRPPWSSVRSFHASFGHARPSLGAGGRVDHVGVDTTAGELTIGEKPLAGPLPCLCLSGVWGRLTHRSRLSASPLGFLLCVFTNFSLVWEIHI